MALLSSLYNSFFFYSLFKEKQVYSSFLYDRMYRIQNVDHNIMPYEAKMFVLIFSILNPD